MATSFNLPASPTTGQTAILPNGEVVTWTGDAWERQSSGGGGGSDSFATLEHIDGGVPQYLNSTGGWATSDAPEKLLLDGGNF